MDVTQLALTLPCVAKRWKTCFDLRTNLISTKVSASHRKSTQVDARPGQTESQVDPSFQLVSTCDSVYPGFKSENQRFSRDWKLKTQGTFTRLISLSSSWREVVFWSMGTSRIVGEGSKISKINSPKNTNWFLGTETRHDFWAPKPWSTSPETTQLNIK